MADELHVPKHPVRIVTAASLFDGHDASINIMRRLFQSQGCEVIHLGHNRTVDEIVTAALHEDVQAVAVSSYQGGHNEYFRYLIDQLRSVGLGHVKVYGGGGGVIVPSEIAELEAYGVTKIFSPHDGQTMGLVHMINSIVQTCDVDPIHDDLDSLDGVLSGDSRDLSRAITALELGRLSDTLVSEIREIASSKIVPVLGITGTGGAGKSSLTDELIRRFRLDQSDKLNIAVIAIDPTRRRAGGALLGDRIRMNTIQPPQIFFRSIATRGVSEIPEALDDMLAVCKAAGFDLVVVETPGIGQGDAGIVDHVDVPIYVMTPEFGAASQLEKIDMLDYAHAVLINKFERRGAEDALRDVRRQIMRNREEFDRPVEDMPVFGTMASRFNDDGVTAAFQFIRDELKTHGLVDHGGQLPSVDGRRSSGITSAIPGDRIRYLAEIAATVTSHHRETVEQVEAVRLVQHLETARSVLSDRNSDSSDIQKAITAAQSDVTSESREQVDHWPTLVATYEGETRDDGTSLVKTSLSGVDIPRVALPRFVDHGEILRFLRSENVPGEYPYTAGVFPFKRPDEEPARMFAGEGDAARTNRRFHMLAEGQPATRLSTAFDSVTLYGFDPDRRPDIYGKVGNAGVSIATLDDMKVLYQGFDLVDPSTSVSMTINGPAPMILAMFLNTAIDQQVDKFTNDNGREPTLEEATVLREHTLRTVRGTVQADILKEDQGQNTCIFSTEFALAMMADIQEWFVEQEVRNFYSVSISGYHIAEAGANPITQLAFTLANGFTYVESYLARGLDIDDFAPNLSFFFSNGMDPEYAVLGRVARRIWAIAMKERYGANSRSQKLKYHVQTSGRSLHAQEMQFNDIRTTLQALIALYDNCNSLHTNAFDEAVTTPTDESVRRALAIQLIINREWGLSYNENPNQGSYIIEELTDLLESAVLEELERISERGGVLGAMETGYQRGKIQDESMVYEHRKHDGSLPIIGVNTFIPPNGGDDDLPTIDLARSTDAEKESQLSRLQDFHNRHQSDRDVALDRLREAALGGENLFGVLMDVVRVCSLGEITHTLFDVGGRYRRNV